MDEMVADGPDRDVRALLLVHPAHPDQPAPTGGFRFQFTQPGVHGQFLDRLVHAVAVDHLLGVAVEPAVETVEGLFAVPKQR